MLRIRGQDPLVDVERVRMQLGLLIPDLTYTDVQMNLWLWSSAHHLAAAMLCPWHEAWLGLIVRNRPRMERYELFR